MQRQQMVEDLRTFITHEILDGRDAGLDEDTPLLEWGIINSISASMLSTFVKERYGIDVPQSEMVATNLESIGAFVDLLERLQPATSG